ncbi:putative GDSL esterase/lipase CPRD49 [Cocos nucifera]|uniref:Putative GDSL esterase/lipase CPRD49 n=1 Tax=Cocos nucifera TaxID=13894 RepID=A0A8K0IWB2_COCNU|nr:putative GDSL esterase/lipase CPRD49 [Cocos nucifera]
MAPHPSGLGPHVPLPEYIENMSRIAKHLKSLSEKTRIIFLSCPPISEEMLQQSTSPILRQVRRTNETCQKYSEACKQLCKDMDLKVVDLWTAIQKRDDWATFCFTIAKSRKFCCFLSFLNSSIQLILMIRDELFQNLVLTKLCSSDGIHFSPEGSKIVVAEILMVLKEAEWEPSLHWKSLPTEFGEESPYNLVAANGISTINPSEWTFYREIQWD